MRQRLYRRIVRALAIACACALVCCAAWAQATAVQGQIAEHEQKLADAQKKHQQAAELTELMALAPLYRLIGKPQKSLEDYNAALTIERSINNTGYQALTLTEIGRIDIDLGKPQDAMDCINSALPMWRQMRNQRGEALALDTLGRVYADLGQPDKAMEYLNQALRIARAVNSVNVQAGALTNIGRVYRNTSRQQEALDSFNKALPFWRQSGERGGEALVYNEMSQSYYELAQFQKALEYDNQALAIWRETGNRQGEASTLHNVGRVYEELGQFEKALDFYNQALPVWREVQNRSGEAVTLNDIGWVYSSVGQKMKALDYYNQALPIWREVKNRAGEALTLNDLGRLYTDLDDKQKALDAFGQALPIWREVQNKRGESATLASIGRIYLDTGQLQKSLNAELAALSLVKTAGDPDLQGSIDTGLMLGFRKEKQTEEAIFFGMEAVNAYQQIRKNITGLDKDLQKGYAEAKSPTYRVLAEMLVQTDRLAEAEKVLDLLKEEELKEVVRGAADEQSKVEPLKLTEAQQKVQNDLAAPEKTAETLAEMSVEYDSLRAKATRTPAEDARMKTLDTNIEQQNAQVSDFFAKTLYPELARNMNAKDANELLKAEKSDVSQLQNTLAELGPRVLGIRLLLGEDHAYAIVVTAHAREKFELKATPAQLRDKVLQVRDDLRTPSSDPKPHLAELYAMVVAPLSDELKAVEQAPAGTQTKRAPTLLWSLDGVLRYLPMSALYDGQHYMIERFNNVLFTPESYGHMAAAGGSASGMHVLAMGLSNSYGGLPALPGVTPELDAVAHDPAVPDSHGPMDGKLLENEQFTFAALKDQLGTGKTFPVVHIASHFVEEAGGGDEPYLMLGGNESGEPNGYQLTLSRMEDSTISFHGTQLLTLSACSTAKGDASKDGQEMDSLGMIAQQKDAGAVLATLWDVNDASTSKLMSDFYSRWVKNGADGKAEALRQAQLALLHGSAGSSTKGANDRGFQTTPQQAPAAAGYSHPFYWAPFVLMGNFQ